MTNSINLFKVSSALVMTASMVSIFALAVLLYTPEAKASEYPNILIGQSMTMGSTGQNVVVLQGLMTELGYLNVPAGIPFGYYGSMTRDAVAKYQSSNFVSPTAGYYGPQTMTAMRNDFASHGWLNVLGW